MEELTQENNDDSQPGQSFPEVNMDLLVEAGFNKTPYTYQHNQRGAKFISGGELVDPVSQHNYYLNGLQELSPRNISVEQANPNERDTPASLLIDDSQVNNIPLDLRTAHFPLAHDLQTFSPMLVDGRCGAPSLPKELLSQPEVCESQEPIVLETSVLPQREWQGGPHNGGIDASMGLNSIPTIQNIPMRSSLPMTVMEDPISLARALDSSRGEAAVSRSLEDSLQLRVAKDLRKPCHKKSEKTDTENEALAAVTSPQSAGTPRTTRKTVGRRRSNATAHLTLEEKKKLRAARNRESAEKSRMRRKQMIQDLEVNVARLREENRDLKAKVEKYHDHLTSTSAEVRKKSEVLGSDTTFDDQTKLPTLYEALGALQRCMNECPRTFRKGAHSPPIPLNLPRLGVKRV